MLQSELLERKKCEISDHVADDSKQVTTPANLFDDWVDFFPEIGCDVLRNKENPLNMSFDKIPRLCLMNMRLVVQLPASRGV